MKAKRQGSLLRGALAAVLAVGLMWPTAALATEPQGEPTPPLAELANSESEQSETEDSQNLTESEETPQPTEDVAATETSEPAPVTLSQHILTAAHSAATDAVAAAFTTPASEESAASPAASVPEDYKRPADAAAIQVTGGTEGVDYYFENVSYTRDTAKAGSTASHTDQLKKLVICSDKQLTLSSEEAVDATIWIAPGTQADLVFSNLSINSNIPVHIERNRDKAGVTIKPITKLHITLADRSDNVITAIKTGYSAGIHCGVGTELVIDDSVKNTDVDNKQIVPENGLIPEGTVYIDNTGVQRTASKTSYNSLSNLDSKSAGKLTVTSGYKGAGIGSVSYEDAGSMTFNGGVITAKGFNNPNIPVTNTSSENWYHGVGAGIGSGEGSSPTEIVINGGTISATGAYHGAAIGGSLAAWYDGSHTPPWFGRESSYLFKDSVYSGKVENSSNSMSAQTMGNAGNIRINGGLVMATAPYHGNAIGKGCAAWNKDGSIIITGGTVLPDSTASDGFMDVGGNAGYVVITGGSVRTDKSGSKFENKAGNGYAYGSFNYDQNDDLQVDERDSNKVRMVEINLQSEKVTNTEIIDWELLISGEPSTYGAPSRFTDGCLYLWLPEKVANNEEITVNLSYRADDGSIQKIDPLFRNPTHKDEPLKRYVDFRLEDSPSGATYLEQLKKYYDGSAFEPYDIEKSPIVATEPEGTQKTLDNKDSVTYKYQQYTQKDGEPLGKEVDENGKMPSNVGVMKFTMTSTQYSGQEGFNKNYWGHRATGWCEIMPIDSKVTLVEANWPDNKPGHEQDSAHKLLTIHATIDKADKDPDGKPTGDACKAPRGFVQLFVDGQAVGDPVKLVFQGDLDEEGSEIKAGDERINAREVARGEGSYTDFTYAFTPSSQDFLLPDATKDNRHIVSLQYIHPVNDDKNSALYSMEPANYLDSVNPAENPEAAPKAEIAIEPVDPTTDVALGDDPDADPDAPEDPDAPKPTVTTNGTPTPADPNDPESTRTFGGTISTVYDIPSEENPHPGRVTLNVKTSSSGPVSVTSEDGEVFEADFVRGEDGEPVRNPDGTYTLVLDPTAVGKGKLTFRQEPNGAHTGTTWSYDVDIQPNPKIRPQTSVAKRAENLTHPDGPTQPGDRIRYTVTAANAAKGSAWTDVMLSDRLPAALELDESSVRLASTSEKFDGALKKAAAPTSVGTFALAGPDADGRVTISAFAGSVYGGSEAVLTFECTVAEDAVGADLANIAEVQGSRPDPDNPGGKLPENPGPSDPALPEGGGKVAPADPEIESGKAVENLTAPDAKVTRVGDVLRYTVTLANKGSASSCLVGAAISDPLPAGLEPVAGSIKMTLVDGTEKVVDDSAYDKESRTLAVTAGDLWGGQSVTLVFDCTVGEGALGADNANIARVHGKVPSENPGDGSQPTDPEPGEPADPSAGGLVDQTPPASPKTLVGNDPADGDLSVEKEAANLTRDDGTTRVGDTVRYTIRLANSGAATSWMNAVLRDELPKGIEPLSGTIKVTLPDGTEKGVDDAAYDEKTRVLSVSAGQLYGGQEVVLAFDALVTEAAFGADIGNTAVALGVPPSRWDPDSEHPEAGEPYAPPAGWEALELETEKISSNVAYPPGTDAKNGPLPAEGDGDGAATGKKVDDSKTIAKTRLAQTGDDVRGIAALGALAVLAAGALALATRRGARCNR